MSRIGTQSVIACLRNKPLLLKFQNKGLFVTVAKPTLA